MTLRPHLSMGLPLSGEKTGNRLIYQLQIKYYLFPRAIVNSRVVLRELLSCQCRFLHTYDTSTSDEGETSLAWQVEDHRQWKGAQEIHLEETGRKRAREALIHPPAPAAMRLLLYVPNGG